MMSSNLICSALAATLLTILSGCGGGSSSSGTPDSTVQQETMDITEVTNKAGCIGDADPGSTINEVWYKHFQGTSAHFSATLDMSFDLTNNGIAVVTNTCRMSNGKTLRASVQIPYSVNGNTVEFLAADQKTVEDNSNGTHASCSVSAQKRTFQYSLVGGCLKATMDGKTDYLVNR